MKLPNPAAAIAAVGMDVPMGCGRRNAAIHLTSLCAFFGCRHYPSLAERAGDRPTRAEKRAHHKSTRETVRLYARMIRSELEVAP